MNYPYKGIAPEIAAGVFVAPGARLIGRVRLAAGSSVWYNTVLRGDADAIEVGPGTNIQDLTMVHCDEALPTRIGANVTIGHSCIIHGCTISDNVLVGMGSTILNGARIGENSLVGAGSLVTEGKEFPPGSVLMGRPARVVRSVTERDLERIQRGHEGYRRQAADHMASATGGRSAVTGGTPVPGGREILE